MEEFEDILKRKIAHYGGMSPAVIEFAAEEYATRKMIQENESILEMAKAHMDQRTIMVLNFRIAELKNLLNPI